MKLFNSVIMLLGAFVVANGSTNPECPSTSLRKEANDVTDAEWKMIVSTIQAARGTPGDDGLSVWERVAKVHNDLALSDDSIHQTCTFLFFHR
jgi:hypothetical protein